MKLISLLFAALLGLAALHAQATELFVGVDGSPFVLWKDCRLGPACSSRGYDGHSAGYGARVGFWLPHETEDSKYGFELGYDRLGSISGATPYQGTAATWKNDASIVYLDWLGYAVPPHLWDSGGLIGKIGLYGSSVKTNTSFGAGGAGFSRTVSGGGLMMGAGYAYPFTDNFMVRTGLDVFFGVTMSNPMDAGSNLSEILARFAVQLDLTF